MARFFNYFPKTFYSLDTKKSSLETVTNITARFSFEESLKDNSTIFYKYELKEGDTPEIVASKYYGNPEKHWIILLFNNIVDAQFDWPLDGRTLNEFVDRKYNFRGSTPASYKTNVPALPTAILQAAVNNPNYTVLFKEYIGGRMLGDVLNDDRITSADSLAVLRYSNFGFANSTNTIEVDTYIRDNLIPTIENNYIKYSSLYGTASYTSNVQTDLIVFTPAEGEEYESGKGISWAKTNTHSYYKVVTQTTRDKITVQKFEVDANTYANNTMMENGTNEVYELQDNTSVNIVITKETKSFFDYELELNESKREIRLLKPEFVPAVEKDFKKVVKE